MQYTGVPTNLDEFDDPEDAAHTATDLSQSLAAQLEQQNQACSSLLPTLTPQEIWDTTSDSTSTESYCLAVAEEACTQLALLMVVDDPDAAINGVMFDRWDTHCWALHGLQGIHTGNRTQVGGAIQQRLAGIHSPVVRALIADARFRTAQLTQFGTHCVGGWYGTCEACYTDLTFVIDQPALSGGQDCPWPAGLTKPWLCAHDCEGYWTETEQLTCPADFVGKHAAVRQTYTLTREACCTESFCGRPTGSEFLGLADPVAYSVNKMMGARDVTTDSCAAVGEVFFRGQCGRRSSNWVVAQDSEPDPKTNCPLDGAVTTSKCMMCPGSTPVPCVTCGGNNDPDDNIVHSDGTGCEEYFPFPTAALPNPDTRDATGELACSILHFGQR